MKNKLDFSLPFFFENLKRFWFIPVAGILAYAWAIPYSDIAQLFSGRPDMGIVPYNVHNALMHGSLRFMIVHLALPLVSATAVLSYVNGKKSASALHAMPATRMGLFHAAWTSGLLMTLIPVLFHGLLTAFLIHSAGPVMSTYYIGPELSAPMCILWMATSLLAVFFLYCVSILAATVVGNSLLQIPATLGFHFLPAVIYWAVVRFSNSYLYGYNIHGAIPPKLVVNPLMRIYAEAPVSTPGEDFFRLPMQLYELSTAARYAPADYLLVWDASYYGLYCALGAAVLAAAFFLYRKRPVERSGDSLAFPAFGTAAAILVSFTTMICFTTFRVIEEETSFLPVYAFGAAGAAIGFLASQMILDRTVFILKKKKNMLNLILSLVVSILFIASYQFDLTGYETRVPRQPSGGFSAYFHTGDYYTWSSVHFDARNFASQEELKAIQAFHRSIPPRKKEFQRAAEGGNLTSAIVWLKYHLKDGKEMERGYYVPYHFIESSPDLKTIFESEEYKQSLPIFDAGDDRVLKISINTYANNTGDLLKFTENREFDLQVKDPQQINELLAAMKADTLRETYEEFIAFQDTLAQITATCETFDSATMLVDIEFELKASSTNTLNWLQANGYADYFPHFFTQPDYILVDEYIKIDGDPHSPLSLRNLNGIFGGSDSLEGVSRNHYNGIFLFFDAFDSNMPAQAPSPSGDYCVVTDPHEVEELLTLYETLPVDVSHFYRLSLVYVREDGSTDLLYRYVRPDRMPAHIADYFRHQQELGQE